MTEVADHAEEDEVIKTNTNDVLKEEDGKEAYAYIDRPGFTSEIFKIEIRGMPKFYGINELKKLLNKKLELNTNKIKVLRPGNPYCFVCFRNEEDRLNGISKLNGYIWKGSTLVAVDAKPSADPLVKKRHADREKNEESIKKRKTVEECTTSLSHLDYSEQLKQKQNNMREVLKRYGGEVSKLSNTLKKSFENSKNKNDGLPFELMEIRSAPNIDGYRNKCEFSIGKDENEETVIGFRLGSYANGFTEIGSIQHLKHIPDKMKLAVKLFEIFVRNSQMEVFNAENHTGYFRNLTVRVSQATGDIMLVVGIHPQQLSEEEIGAFKQSLIDFFKSGEGKELNLTSLYYEEMRKRQPGEFMIPSTHLYGSTHIVDHILGLEFRISPEAFFQINSLGAEVLYRTAIELAKPDSNTTLLDICCGTGTIGLCFAKYCKQILGVEIIPQAVEDAKYNAEKNKIENCTFVAGSAEDMITSLIRNAQIDASDNIVSIVDPPRAGLHLRSITQLRNARGLNRLIYISCSPQSAVKNWVDLTRPCSKTMKGDPFIPKIAVAVDMFPHTPHTELVILFERAVEATIVKVEVNKVEMEEVKIEKQSNDIVKLESK